MRLQDARVHTCLRRPHGRAEARREPVVCATYQAGRLVVDRAEYERLQREVVTLYRGWLKGHFNTS